MFIWLKKFSIEKANKIRSLVLVIHGTDDEVIDMSHGMSIHQKCQNPVGTYDWRSKQVYSNYKLYFQTDPLWVEGAGHNDVVFIILIF